MTIIFAALSLGTSQCPPANHLWQAQEDLAQRRRDAKYGFPQFILLFLCALAALREILFFHWIIIWQWNGLAMEWFGNGMIEIRACAIPLPHHSSAILSLTER
ncbi:MAG: hypothetical protein NTW21_38410 [Verrucomicrobia bacterium]|nr:hypothetical protein [Verrucomicrobiota bacterium]